VNSGTKRHTAWQRNADGTSQGAWWNPVKDEDRIECVLCPRKCRLKPGDRGFCFVRENRDGEMVLTTYGRSTGFCIDPIEKKPLNHFYPGTAVLSFGTAGCNLGCKFCQNWDISKSREVERLSATAEPESIAEAALAHGCQSVAYTYNDPVIWAEYAIDTARECRERDIRNVAVTAGYITPEARGPFFEFMDAANVDLKAFTEDFYQKVTYSHLEPVLDTLSYLKCETDVWFELTNLLIPNLNDSPGELRKMCGWVLEHLGDEVPMHFTAFHPDFRMMDYSRTDPSLLIRAQEIAWAEGIRYAYVGNVHDRQRQSTFCHRCKNLLVDRNWYELGEYRIDADGRCSHCRQAIPGRFGNTCGSWGAKRQPIRIEDFSASTESPPAKQESAQSHTSSRRMVYPISTGSDLNSQEHVKDNIVSQTPTQPDAPQPQPNAPPQLLNLEKIAPAQQQKVCEFASEWLMASVRGEEPAATPAEALGDFADAIVMGAFVTVKRGDLLRGCCGVLGKPMPVGSCVGSAAIKTAKEDRRMAPISACELPYLDLDVTLLGGFEKVNVDGSDRIGAVEIGKRGLMIQRGKQSGLLLPSVAVERGWNAEQFLHAVCQKAGLPIGAWEQADTQLFTFLGKSMGVPLGRFVPEDHNSFVAPPVSVEALTQYTRVVGQNIAAFSSGGTPSYVIPGLPDATVNAVVMGLQWQSDGEDSPMQQGNLIQVSYRPGVPLQSTLYQMSQQAAEMFRQRGFAGKMQVGLTIGFDPAMHGYGPKADLEGLNTVDRGILISDSRHCGLGFDPGATADETRNRLRELLPISSRDAALHSLQIVSTMPKVVCVSGPQAVSASGIRPPAVAGKFYPAEDAARRAMVGTLFKEDAPETSSPLAIMVPHAGIKYSGKVATRVWRSLENPEARTMIVISPKHTPDGVNWSVCPFDAWQLSGTTSIAGDPQLAKAIAEAVTPVGLDAVAHQNEHGIEVQLPILERLAPNAKVVGMALNGGSVEDILTAAGEFAEFLKSLPELPLLVISSDMNHYAPEAENRRRDRLALDAMATGDPRQLIEVCRNEEISMCGLVPAAFVMETLHRLGREFKVEELAYTTSAEVSGDKSQVVGYAGSLLQPA
jgi:AmmeMemoRadiSam system radical SAM enzyme/AmmeMemoRadiSam system protein B/AmmeMemoRadiSam system protein A